MSRAMKKRMRLSAELGLSYIAAFLMSFPAFLNIGPGGVSLGRSIWAPKQGFTVPASVVPVAMLVCLALVKCLLGNARVIRPRSGLLLFAALFVLASSISLIVGQLGLFSLQAVLFYLQLVLPVGLLFLGIYLARVPQRVPRLVWLVLLGEGVASWGLLAQSVAHRGVIGTLTSRVLDYIGPFYIWGIADYFPVVVTYTATIALALFFCRAAGWRMFVLAVVPALITVPLNWSKGAVATLGVAVVFAATAIFLRGRYRVRVVLFAVLAFALVAAAVLSPLQPISVQRLRHDLMSGGSGSISARVERWVHSIRTLSASPFIGIGFSPERSPEGSLERVFRSHNQYLDLWLKGGMLALASFLILAFWALWVLVSRYRRAASRFEHGLTAGVLAGWAAVLIVSNMLQVNFAQPYPASVLWFTLGLTEGYFVHRRLAGAGDPVEVAGAATEEGQ